MVTLGILVSPATAAPHASRAAGPRSIGVGQERLSITEITLITGDRIRVATGPGGRQSAVVEARYGPARRRV